MRFCDDCLLLLGDGLYIESNETGFVLCDSCALADEAAQVAEEFLNADIPRAF